METNESGVMVTSQLCYYVETVRTKQQMWLPYTCLQLAGRSRPFYGNYVTNVTQPQQPAADGNTTLKKVLKDFGY